MTTIHTNCRHEATKTARAACRRDLLAEAKDLVREFDMELDSALQVVRQNRLDNTTD